VISVVFEYEVKEGLRAEFERVYGSDGDWARFFRAGEGYLGTELHAAVGDSRAVGTEANARRRFLVVDRWTTQEAYADFLAANAAGYEQRSQAVASLYVSETRIGSFERVGPATAPRVTS
jgi:heme-degrading monooxygenase HmoA